MPDRLALMGKLQPNWTFTKAVTYSSKRTLGAMRKERKVRIKLYKYTPHIESFIERPMLRCTLASQLNDPFELRPSNELFEEFNNAKNSGPINIFSEADLLLGFNYKGVISLSESKTNLLMWSHYANEHSGGVIEFSFDIKLENNQILQRGLFKNIADSQYIFNRVKYVFERSEINSTTEYSKTARTSDLLPSLGFCKADPWSYEKEHRFVCDTFNSDKALIITGEGVNRMDILEILSRYDMNVLEGESEALAIDMKSVGHMKNFHLQHELNESDCSLMHFYEVRPESVTGLYFGCSSDLNRFNDIADSDQLVKFVNLGDNVMRAKLSKRRYELEFLK
ncbi:MAG: hypothetical protein ACI9SP_004814 [Arenicella sp.]